MFRPQGNVLSGPIVGNNDDLAAVRRKLNTFAENLGQLLTGCGQLDHDTDGKTFDLHGESGENAGVSGDHGILHVRQYNRNAGTSSNPNLYAAIFEGPVKLTVAPRGVVRLAVADGNWVPAVHPLIPHVRAIDNHNGAVVIINLHRPNPAVDPNVRSGYTVLYTLDPDGDAIAVGSYLDEKIGCIKDWSGSTASIPGGWQICDGTNGTPDLRNRFLVGAGSTYAVGATGGGTSHAHTISGGTASGTASVSMSGSVASGTASISVSGATASGTASISMSGSTASGTASISVSGSTANALTSSVNTDYAATGITATNSTSVTANLGTNFQGGGALSAMTTFSSEPHSHTLTEPTNGGAGTGHRHAVSGLSHSHGAGTLAASDSGHTHGAGTLAATDAGHTHSAGTLAATDAGHAHSSGTLAATDAGHVHGAGTLAADSAANNSLPPYYSLAKIMRVD